MSTHILKDMGFGFFVTLIILVIFLFLPKIITLQGLMWFLLLPICFYLTVFVIGLIGKKKRGIGIPIGILVFFLFWAAVAVYQGQQAANFARKIEEQSTPLKWDVLPNAILTGNPVQPWQCDGTCTQALINGLTVFTRYNRGVHRLSIGAGEKCLHPKSVRTNRSIGRYLPSGKCFIAEDVSEKSILAVEFIEKNPESEARDQTILGSGYPRFTWSYFPWDVVLHHRGIPYTFASGFTGKTQYPFWLPIPYLAFPGMPHFAFLLEGKYGVFGWSRLFASTTPIGQGWTNETFIRNLAFTAGLIPLKRPPTIYLKANETGVPQTPEEREAIRKRLTILANSADPYDREAAFPEIKRWGQAGGELEEIRSLIEVLLRYDLSYRRDQLYTELSHFGDSTPDWLATLLITIDPDWSKRELGRALLKAAPYHSKIVEEKQMKQFIRDLDLRNGDSRNMEAIALLLPRFGDKSLMQIYSNCRFSKLNEIDSMFHYFERQRFDKDAKSFYTQEEIVHYSRHVIPCLKERPKTDYSRVRFEKQFGEIS